MRTFSGASLRCSPFQTTSFPIIVECRGRNASSHVERALNHTQSIDGKGNRREKRKASHACIKIIFQLNMQARVPHRMGPGGERIGGLSRYPRDDRPRN